MRVRLRVSSGSWESVQELIGSYILRAVVNVSMVSDVVLFIRFRGCIKVEELGLGFGAGFSIPG